MSHYFINDKNLKKNEIRIDSKINNIEFSFFTDNGVFNKNGLDYGTRLLLENVNLENKKSFLDVGCGCGPIGIYIAKKSINNVVDMIDINEKAINLTKKAIKYNKLKNAQVFKSNIYENVDKKYDMIITNPPIHAGKIKIYEIIEKSVNYLNSNGELWIVMRKDHGVKTLIKDFSNTYKFTIITKDKGFYVVEGKIFDND